MTYTYTPPQPTAPGLHLPAGKIYPSGLITEWSSRAIGQFSVALKIYQQWDASSEREYREGIREALRDAVAARGVVEIRAALIPAWNGGMPDWRWIERTIADLALRAGGVRAYARLGNFRDGEAEGCDFAAHAGHEAHFGGLLAALSGGRLLWSAGDDRGLVASVKGWRERKAIYAMPQFSGAHPDSIEIQDYQTLPANIPLVKQALRREGFCGAVALVEHHRGFPGKLRTIGDMPELFTAETGEYLRLVYEECRAAGVSHHMFTGDYAFASRAPWLLNPAGIALFNCPRVEVEPWTPNALKSWWRGLRLRA